jgi:aspartyl-tRNA(Asn)/glutamyl-tRNA(Gln) amidotransferase subunit C
VAEWEPKLAQVTEFFSQLRDIDVTDVSPSLRALEDEEPSQREDKAVQHPMAEAFMDSVPEREGDLIKVPKIGTGADAAK